jgi:acyl-coenzyme A thioesterase PaaI-like protein
MSERVPLDPMTFGGDQPCFGCRPDHPSGLRLQFFREGDVVGTAMVPGDHQQGPPGVMHGGLVTAVADELAAWTVVGLKNRFGFTAAIEARLKKPVRVGVELRGTGRLAVDASRLVKVDVILEQEGETAFTGLFTFALLDRAAAERLLGRALPEHWARFGR